MFRVVHDIHLGQQLPEGLQAVAQIIEKRLYGGSKKPGKDLQIVADLPFLPLQGGNAKGENGDNARNDESQEGSPEKL